MPLYNRSQMEMEECKEVGPDATDWSQSWHMIGRQHDGGARHKESHSIHLYIHLFVSGTLSVP